MIRIAKGAAPAKLTTDGAALAASHSADYDANRAGFRSGSPKIAISERIYKHRSVVAALTAAQHGKCCYCEAKPDKPYAYLTVEHWRPKARVRQERSSPDIWPGYYWLAYDWSNLYLACVFCNSSNKGDQFPLRVPSTRVRDHHGDLTTEHPMLLRPDVDDPKRHIRFHDEVPVGRTAKGRMTVKVLGLDRTDHVPRLNLLRRLKTARDQIARHHGSHEVAALEIVNSARDFIELSILPEAPYSAMAIAFLENDPLPAVTSHP